MAALRSRLALGLCITVTTVFAASVAPSIAGAATAPSGEIYVANFSGGGVSQYGTNSAGVASPLPYPGAPATPRPSHMIISPNGKFVYALDCLSGQVRQYAVDTSGLLAGSLVPLNPSNAFFGGCSVGPTEPTGHSIAEAKSGKFVYVTAVLGGPGGLNTLLEFKVGTTGALTQLAAAETQSINPNTVAVSPNGKFVYVGDPNGLIFRYAVSTTGTLTEASATTTAPACLTDLAFAPNGKHLYATNDCTNQVSNFPANPTTGALGPPVNTAAGGAGAAAIAIAPNAKTLYVADAASNTVSQFAVALTGALSALSPVAIPVGVHPLGVAVSPSSKNAYVTNSVSNTVSEFSIGSTSHLLTPIGTLATGSQPWGLAVRR